MRVFTQAVTPSASLTCYVQQGSEELATAGVRPAVLVLPGGGYAFCSDREAEPVALAYLAEGFNAFALRYAVGPDAPWQQSFADGKAGLAWLRDHAAELDVDPDRIAAVGFSAGGHLAASLGTIEDGRPGALVLGYPVTLAEFGVMMGKEVLDIPSALDGEFPPTFLFGTQSDSLVPVRNSLALLTALAAHDVAFESHLYLLGAHGLSLAKPLTANGEGRMTDEVVAAWHADSVRFLHRIFGDFTVEGPSATYSGLQGRRRIGLDMPIGHLLVDPRAARLIAERLPGQLVADLKAKAGTSNLSIRELLGYLPSFDPDTIHALGADLDALN